MCVSRNVRYILVLLLILYILLFQSMSPTKCIFCKISAGTENTELLYNDDEIVVFQDIKPAAKHHYLAIPKAHIKDAKHLHSDHIHLG